MVSFKGKLARRRFTLVELPAVSKSAQLVDQRLSRCARSASQFAATDRNDGGGTCSRRRGRIA